MSLGRVSVRSLSTLLGLVMLSALLPAGVLAEPDGKPRSYIVTLAVAGAGQTIAPSSRGARQRARSRADRSNAAADRLASDHKFKVRHRYGHAVTGFSARLTPAQAAELAGDAQVASIRPARRFRLAGQSVPTGIRRVNAAPVGAPGPDIDADVAVIDTGIGPVGGSELNIAGGINCSSTAGSEPNNWADSHGHGTHVAGTIGARDNSVGVVGVAPGVRLWSVRIFQGSVTDETNVVCGINWAVATHSNGLPDIDVINMSFEGPRVDYLENCGVIAATPGADPIHKAVCSAHAAGITTVAAAGNFSLDANTRSPGGYDQVISVAAMADFDGTGWGSSAHGGCGYGKIRDDEFWENSNFGREVDIVAPGVCIESTARSGDPGDTETMSGTSMAAPHVTGAVARFIAKYGTRTPDRMRSIVRGAGRLDWDAKSDPLWSGVSDSDEPNRVLDVESLIGPQDVRVWLSHDQFKVGGTDTKRVSRVDVQRQGGYAGAVSLNTAGPIRKGGSASFDSKTLPDLNSLGTNVTLKFKKTAPDGTRNLRVVARGAGGEPAGSRDLRVIVDRTGPRITGPRVAFRDGRIRLGAGGAASVALAWDAVDAHSVVKSTTAHRKKGTGRWRTIARPKGTNARSTLTPGQVTRFRVKAVDGYGNKSTGRTMQARMKVRDSASSKWVRPVTGGWQTLKAKPALGGSFLATSGPAAAISTRIYGKAVAIVAPIAPGRGVMRVRIDGGNWVDVNLKSAAGSHRRVVFSRRLPMGVHKIEIEAFEGPAAVDALLWIR